VVWKQNGSVLFDSGEKYSIPALGLLTINDAREEDAGIYECFAGTNLGGDKINITLIVLSKLCIGFTCFYIRSYTYICAYVYTLSTGKGNCIKLEREMGGTRDLKEQIFYCKI